MPLPRLRSGSTTTGRFDELADAVPEGAGGADVEAADAEGAALLATTTALAESGGGALDARRADAEVPISPTDAPGSFVAAVGAFAAPVGEGSDFPVGAGDVDRPLATMATTTTTATAPIAANQPMRARDLGSGGGRAEEFAKLGDGSTATALGVDPTPRTTLMLETLSVLATGAEATP